MAQFGVTANQMPQAIQQALRQIAQQRKAQGDQGGIAAAPQAAQQSSVQKPDYGGIDPMKGLQAASELMGYSPNTTFGYKVPTMSNMLPKAAGQTNEYQNISGVGGSGISGADQAAQSSGMLQNFIDPKKINQQIFSYLFGGA